MGLYRTWARQRLGFRMDPAVITARCHANHRCKVAERRQERRRMAAESRRRNRR